MKYIFLDIDRTILFSERCVDEEFPQINCQMKNPIIVEHIQKTNGTYYNSYMQSKDLEYLSILSNSYHYTQTIAITSRSESQFLRLTDYIQPNYAIIDRGMRLLVRKGNKYEEDKSFSQLWLEHLSMQEDLDNIILLQKEYPALLLRDNCYLQLTKAFVKKIYTDKDKAKDFFDRVDSHNLFVEVCNDKFYIFPLWVSKGLAISYFKVKNNISNKDCIAAGDSWMDLKMRHCVDTFYYSTLSLVPINEPPPVHIKNNVIYKSNELPLTGIFSLDDYRNVRMIKPTELCKTLMNYSLLGMPEYIW